jgi:hypothetical protein
LWDAFHASLFRHTLSFLVVLLDEAEYAVSSSRQWLQYQAF